MATHILDLSSAPHDAAPALSPHRDSGRPRRRVPQTPASGRRFRGRPAAFWAPILALVGCCASIVVLADGASAEAPAVSFERGNLLYEKGQYPDAVAAYSRFLESGRTSAALWFNLGNASYKAGHLGQALVSYRRAERLAPRDPDIQANLRFTRTQVQGGPPAPDPLWRRLTPRLTLTQWTVVTMSLLWGWLGLWTALHLKPAWWARLKLPLVGVGLGLGLSALALGLNWNDQCLTRHAVVIQRDTLLRHGPLDESPSLQTLVDGQEVVVLDRKNDWFQVAGATRGIGWLKTNQVALLHP